jgi:hypothetical protein
MFDVKYGLAGRLSTSILPAMLLRVRLLSPLMTTLRTLEQAIGQQMRRHREAGGVRQETIAAAATMWMLPWTQATVAAVELGQRGLSLGEFLMLPLVFAEAGLRRRSGQPLELSDFIPAHVDHFPNVPVVPGGFQMPLRTVQTLLRGGRAPAGDPPAPAAAGPGEAERKAARKLGCSPDAIVTAAQQLWSRTLAAERDERIGERAGKLDRRSLQAVRGRVTRGLVRELEPIITGRRRRR